MLTGEAVPGQPQNTPIVQKPTPIVLDQLLVETSDSNKALYDRQLEYGHYHPDQIKYPGHRLLKQGPNAYGLYQYIWGNDLSLQDTYNVAKKYAENANAYPIFVRSYRVLRSDYLVNGPTAKGTTFTGLVAVAMTAGGSGYTKDFAVSFTGGTGSGGAGLAIVNRGAVVRVELTALGSYTVTPTPSFAAGDGTGATATAIIQPPTAYLVAEEHSKLPEDDPYQSLYDRVIRVYKTEPGPILTTQKYSVEARGRLVDTISQEGLNGTLAPESGNGIIESETADLDAVLEKRTTRKFTSGTLPDTEVYYFWDWVPIPTLIFSSGTAFNDYCDGSSFFTLTKTVNKKGGNSQFKKHRVTVSYANTAPTTTAGVSWTTQDLAYDGKVVDFNYNNVLNDALSFNATFNTSSGGSSCGWTEDFDFPATTPSASDFAGNWYVRSDKPEPYGTTGFRRVLIEFYP